MTCDDWFTVFLFEEANHQIPSDPVQPASKAAFTFIGIPAFNSSGDSQQDFLHDVGRVAVLKAFAGGQSEDQRLIDFHELLPCFQIVSIPQSQDQAGSGFGGIVHRTFH